MDRLLGIADMPVISLSPLIVIAEDSLPLDDLDQAVFEPMFGRQNRLGNPPYLHFNETAILELIAPAQNEFDCHDGISCHNTFMASNDIILA